MEPAGQTLPQAQPEHPFSFSEKALMIGATAFGMAVGGLSDGITGMLAGGAAGLVMSWQGINSYRIQGHNPAQVRREPGLASSASQVLSGQEESIPAVEREPLALTCGWGEKITAIDKEKAVLRLMGQSQLSGQILGQSSKSRIVPIQDCSGKGYTLKLLFGQSPAELACRTLAKGEILGFKGNGHNHIVHTYGLLLWDSRDQKYCMVNSVGQIPETDRQYYRIDAVITQRVKGVDVCDAISGNPALGIDPIPGVIVGPQLAIEIGVQVADALCHFHRQGIIYRDLKPENILMDRTTRNALLIDPEMCKKIGRTGTTSTICGTPDYVAPEMIQNQAYSYRLDSWTLGVLLMELACNNTPADYLESLDGFSPTGSHLDKYERSLKFSCYPDDQKMRIMKSPACHTLGQNNELCQLIVELTREKPAERCSVEEALARLVSMH